MPLRRFLARVLLTCLLACASGFSGGPQKVRTVYDGDTVCLENHRQVRYIGIDAPEIDPDTHEGEYLAHRARAFNKDLVERGRIRLEHDRVQKDRYGRVLAYVFLEDGRMVNALMVERGLAYVMTTPPNMKYTSLLLDCQRRAMRGNGGIWRRLSKKSEMRYTGNKRSFRFHTQDCPFGKKISKRHRMEFNTLYEAFWAGYSPCNACRPAAVLKK